MVLAVLISTEYRYPVAGLFDNKECYSAGSQVQMCLPYQGSP